MDHDQRFKTLIREFFADFLLLFFAKWTARLDLSAVEWLDKEIYHDPPEGSAHRLDLIAKVRDKEAEQTPPLSLLLAHVEIEAPDRTTELKPRLPYYYHFLREKYQLPVLPIVLYLKVGLDVIGVDSCVEEVLGFEVNRFRYLYAGLPGLDGLKYVQGDSLLGVALSALMRIPHERVVWLGAEALRRLAEAPLSDQKKFLLSECVQSYLPADEQQQEELEQLLKTETYAEVQAMNKTVYEQGIEKGRRVERLELVCLMIERQFGPVTAEMREHLEQMTMEELWQVLVKIQTASSLEELGLPTSSTEE